MQCLWTPWGRQHSQPLLWGATALLVLDQCLCHSSTGAAAVLVTVPLQGGQELPSPTCCPLPEASQLSRDAFSGGKEIINVL